MIYACAGGLAIALGVGVVQAPVALLPFLLVALIAFGIAARQRLRRNLLVVEAEPTVRTYGPACWFVTATALAVQNRAASVAALCLVATASVWRLAGRRAEGQTIDRVVLFLLAVGSLVWLRIPTVITALSAISLVLVLWSARSNGDTGAVLLASAIQGVAIYLLVSVGAYALGMESPAATYRRGGLEGTAGLFFSRRVAFPLTSSFATAPLLASAFLASVPGHRYLRVSTTQRLIRALGVPAAAFVLLAGNYRGPLSIAILLLTCGYLAPLALARISAPVALGAFSLPFWFPAVSQAVNGILSWLASLLPFLSRGGSDILSSRDLIWLISLERFGSGGLLPKLVGYGGDGHIASGASRIYGRLFQGFFQGDPATTPPHSSAIQVLLDAGLVGLAIFVAVLLLVFRYYRSSVLAGDARWVAGVGALCAMATGAATEVDLAPTARPSVVFWTFVLLAGSRSLGAARGVVVTAARGGPALAGNSFQTRLRVRFGFRGA